MIKKIIMSMACGCTIIGSVCYAVSWQEKFDSMRKLEEIQTLEELRGRYDRICSAVEERCREGYFHDEEIRELDKYMRWTKAYLRGYEIHRTQYLKDGSKEDETMMYILSTQNIVKALEKVAIKDGANFK